MLRNITTAAAVLVLSSSIAFADNHEAKKTEPTAAVEATADAPAVEKAPVKKGKKDAKKKVEETAKTADAAATPADTAAPKAEEKTAH